MSKNPTIILLAAVFVVTTLVIGLSLSGSRHSAGPVMVNQSLSKTPSIKSSADLNTASADLDSTDLNSIDSQLTQMDTDTSAF